MFVLLWKRKARQKERETDKQIDRQMEISRHAQTEIERYRDRQTDT